MKEEYTYERLQEWSKSDLIWLVLEMQQEQLNKKLQQ
tara:strand:- start:362 stop:472 length:111 start_codon:yes stop_codon:yes gene_type:complete